MIRWEEGMKEEGWRAGMCRLKAIGPKQDVSFFSLLFRIIVVSAVFSSISIRKEQDLFLLLLSFEDAFNHFGKTIIQKAFKFYTDTVILSEE
uniref:Uncharacterized protein n=1 Tax=Caenorhabditis tropicalis TaxID=1561998 RepID=A0A1I7TKT3_9PELO